MLLILIDQRVAGRMRQVKNILMKKGAHASFYAAQASVDSGESGREEECK